MGQEVYGLPPTEPPDPDTMPATTMALIVGLVVVALAFVIVGIGFAAGWWDDAEPEPVVATPKAEPEPEPLPMAGAELVAAPDPDRPLASDDVDPFAGAEPVPEIAPTGGSRSSGSAGRNGGGSGGAGSGAGAGASTRASVAFVIEGHYEFVEMEIGGKIVRLSANRTLQLPPGGYRVKLRKGPDQPWQPAGLITIELGTRYRVTLLDPPVAKLEVLK